ncbi:MAG: carboxypeptidase regulatory-like domain-containing protein [Acidobacteriia bacterium]|nr:carboxypeptidase regulatory-like domain-containing protein [Terriglobia bacterium]
MRTLRLLAMGMVFLAWCFGQATDGIIVGKVSDASGAAVSGATVTATNTATNVKYTSPTNETGDYRLNNVPVGQYSVSATAKGFAAATVTGVQLDLNHTAAINLTLAVGTVTTQVDVTESNALIDTSTAQLQTTFDSRTAVEVPMAAHAGLIGEAGIWNLSLVGAGVASQGGNGQGTGPSIGGQRPENNSFNIDGVLNDDHYTTGPQVYISNEAIQQFNLVQNNFSAEFGGGSGGIFNVIVKSGTNQIHGSVYEYMANRKLDAVDANNTHQGVYSLPRFDSNRLGASIGGPILKDKLFYFGDFEYAPLGQASQPASEVDAPTSLGLSTLNSMTGLSKTNLGVFEKYVPVATAATGTTIVNGVAIPTGPLSFASPNYNNQYDAIAAVDYNISNKDQLRGRFIYANSTGIDFNANLPVFYAPNPTISKSISVSEFHNFSPTLENELRLSYKRNNAAIPTGGFDFPNLSAFPNISFDDLGFQMGPDPNTPSGSIENTAQLQENITKSWGRHTIKAGYALVDVILTGTFVQRVRGDYDYTSLEEYLLDHVPSGSAFGTPNSGERTVGATNGVPFGNVEHSFFVNDDFRLRPNLTLNFGVRYEYVTVPVGSRYQQYSSPANVPGVISFDSPKANPNEWSPRLGFAYSPGTSGLWSIRGGVSRSFANTYINLNQNASPAYFATTVDVGRTTPPDNFLANGGLNYTPPGVLTPAAARAAISTYTFDQTRPYALNGTIGVQRVLGHDYTLEARYVYTKGVHLWNQTRLNVVTPVTSNSFIPTFLQMPSAATLAGLKNTVGSLLSAPINVLEKYGFPNNIVGYHPWGNSRYNGLALQLTKRYSKNFSVIAAYTWSHNFDDSTATNFSTSLSPRRAQDYQNMRAEWASSALDRRQRLTITPIYDFKPFQGKNWLMKNVIGNWNISGTYTYQSPEFAVVQSGIDSNLNGDALDRSIINPGGAAGSGSSVVGYTATGQSVSTFTSRNSCLASALCQQVVAYVANTPGARYITAGLGALSNSGRNTMPLDHTNNVDAALMKRVNFTERVKFDLGVQAFNLFNHSQFVGGFLNDVAPLSTAGVSTAWLQARNPAFGDYKAYFSNNSRAAQLVAHITF